MRMFARAEHQRRHEDEQSEEDQRPVERRHELGVRAEHGEAVVRHGSRHRAEDAERRQRHDVVRELEHDGHDGVHDLEERLGLRADVRRRDADERREDDDLEHVLLRHRVHDVGRKEVQQRLDEGLRLAPAPRPRAAGAGPSPGPHDVRDRQAERERRRRRDLEVDDRLHAHPADGLDVAGLSDPDDDRREDQRDDQELDEVDEGLRQEPERLVGVRMRLGRKQRSRSTTPRTSA